MSATDQQLLSLWLAERRAANLAEICKVLEHIRQVRGIRNTETRIHLQTYRLL